MTPSEVIYKLLYDARMSQRELAAALEYSSPGTISNRLNRDGMNMSTFDEMLKVFGYEIVVRPVGSPDDEIVVNAVKK